MKIAIFTEVFLPKIDGITNRLANTLKQFVALGHEVLLFVPANAKAHFPGIKINRISGFPLKIYPELNVSMPHPKILSQLSSFKPDVVHCVGPVCLGLWGVLASRMLNFPLVASYHTHIPKYLPKYGFRKAEQSAWKIFRWIHNQALVNLCPSKDTAKELKEHGFNNIGIWRGGVDTSRFHPSKKSNEMRYLLSNKNPESPIILYAGRLGFEKGIENLKPILNRFRNVRLAIVGDGPARQNLEAQFNGKNVNFLGFLKGDTLANAFASADFFAMPSTTETLGFVTLEAMSSGTPVVAANAGGTVDIIEDGKNGLLYNPGQPAELLEAFERLLDDPEECKYFSRNGRTHAEACSWEAETIQLENAYMEAIRLAEHKKYQSFRYSDFARMRS